MIRSGPEASGSSRAPAPSSSSGFLSTLLPLTVAAAEGGRSEDTSGDEVIDDDEIIISDKDLQ